MIAAPLMEGLYRWQEEALDIWLNEESKRGLVEAATGTGKTRFAIECIKQFLEEDSGIAVIMVPRQPLFDQWQEELRDFLEIPYENYSCFGNGYSDSINRSTKILIVTQQAVVRQQDKKHGCGLLKQLNNLHKQVLLVVDEAHHLGGAATLERFVKHIPESYSTLGLTATPDRIDGKMDEVFEYFDYSESEGPIYSYPLADAVEDGVLVPVEQSNYFVSLTEEESLKYEELSLSITSMKKAICNTDLLSVDISQVMGGNIAYLRKLESELFALRSKMPSRKQYLCDSLVDQIRNLQSTYIQRKKLLNKASAKWELLERLLKQTRGVKRFSQGRWIFFHQEIEECEKTADILIKHLGEDKVRLHHSGISTEDRDEILDVFDRGEFSCLCAVQTLDEGLDIPDLAGTIIISGSTNKRQQIQRCGRALRRAPNKSKAILTFFLVNGDNDLSGEMPLIGPENETNKWKIKDYKVNLG